MAYNLFATDKQRNYPGAATQQQPQIAGAAHGATPQEFAQGKQNANSQSGAAPATATTPQQPAVRQQAAAPQPAAAPAVTRTDYQKPIDPTSTTAGLDALNALYTSPQEEERLRQASLQRQRIMAVGDALRHIGNIYNTVNYAPPQIFNSPVETEHKRYLSEKQLRDQNNLKFMTYQQAKAAQDAKMKQASDALDLKYDRLKYESDKFNRQQSLNELKEKNRAWYQQATIQQKEDYLEIQRALAEGRISKMEADTALARVKASQGGFAPRSGSGRGGDNLAGRVVEESRTYTPDGKTATITKKWSNPNNGQKGSTTRTKRQSKYRI